MKKSLQNSIIVVCLLIGISILGNARLVYADSAEVLPKGITRVSVDYSMFFSIDERYNPDGDVEDIAVDYNKTLNSSVFSGLSAVETVFGMPAGSANIGKSVVSLEYEISNANISFMYGLTDRVTMGINIPYWRKKNKVDASLDASGATVGKSSALDTIAPIGVADTVPLTTEDVQQLLGNGLDINGNGTIDATEPSGFGYDRVETWSGSGIGDIEAGLRYQYSKNDNWRLAFTGGMRLPTGKVDDRDNLMDLAFGEGAYIFLFRSNNDYTGLKNWVFNGTAKYDLYLPQEINKRVPGDVNSPITSNKEKVTRKIGNMTELEASGKYSFLKGFNLSFLYKYGYASQDEVSGDKGYAYESLEKETDYTEHVGVAGLGYSTLPLYMEKKFPLPLTVSLAYRNRFAGSNNVLKSQYINFGVEVLF